MLKDTIYYLNAYNVRRFVQWHLSLILEPLAQKRYRRISLSLLLWKGLRYQSNFPCLIYSNLLHYTTPDKKAYFYLTPWFINQTICCGYSNKPSQRDGLFEYPQHIFWLRNKIKNQNFTMNVFWLTGAVTTELSWLYGNCVQSLPLDFQLKFTTMGIPFNSNLLSSLCYFPVDGKCSECQVCKLSPWQWAFWHRILDFRLLSILWDPNHSRIRNFQTCWIEFWDVFKLNTFHTRQNCIHNHKSFVIATLSSIYSSKCRLPYEQPLPIYEKNVI